jgi:hypothetical protein
LGGGLYPGGHHGHSSQPRVKRLRSTFIVGNDPQVVDLVAGLAGLDITSTIEEIDAPRRIVWGGPAQGIVAVHVWSLEPREGGVLVRTAESWEGGPVDAQRETLQSALDESLRTWLNNLKRAAEDAA